MAERKMRKLSFPKNFMWGASISTHQVEGNNHNQWSSWELETAQVKVARAPYNYDQLDVWDELKDQMLQPSNYVSAKAADHFKRYELDFDIAKELNLNTLRTGIEWSRIEPEDGMFDQTAVLHYKIYFSALKKRGISPIITLWHWTFPQWFADKGGFEKRRNVKYFTRYVKYITEQLGMEFDHVITINEPTVYSTMSYHESRWPPEKHSAILTLLVMLNLHMRIKKATKL